MRTRHNRHKVEESGTPPSKPHRNGIGEKIRDRFTGISPAKIFLRPAVLLVLLLTIFPLVFSLVMTFTNWNLVYGNPQFSGLENWKRLLTDGRFWVTAKNTLLIVGVGTILQYVLGLSLALLVLRVTRGQTFFRLLFLIPMMISPVAVGYIVGRMMLNETQGPVNDVLTHLGLPAVSWLSDPTVAPWTVILTDTWQWTSLMFIFLLAGLQSIPDDVYEAAKIDGAKSWQTFLHITFPLLVPVTVTVILIRALELFKIIDIVRVMTGGGPGNATETSTLYVYRLALENGAMAYASTIGYALMIMAIISSLAYLGITRRFVERAN